MFNPLLLKLEKRPSDSKVMAYLSPVIAITLTLIAGGILFYALGEDPFEALYTFFISPLSDVYGWTELGIKVAPLLSCAMGLTLCFKAKIWNIGAEGQFIMGALGGGYVSLQFLDAESSWVLVPILLAGTASGLLWAAIAAYLKTKFKANEILTTIMLNYIALNALLYGVHGPLKDPDGFNFPQSALFSDAALLPAFSDDYRLNISLLFGLFALVAIWTVMARSWVGYQIQVLGEDAAAATLPTADANAGDVLRFAQRADEVLRALRAPREERDRSKGARGRDRGVAAVAGLRRRRGGEALFFRLVFFWFYFLVSRPLARSVVVSSTPRRSSRRRTLRLVRGTNDIRDRVPRRRARQRPPAVQRAETVQPPRARGRVSSRGVWRRRGDGGGGDDERRRVPVIARRGGAGPRDGRDGSARTMKTEARPAREHEVRRKKTEDA